MILSTLTGYCQVSNDGLSVRVKDGASISAAVPFEQRFVYPQFLQSTITLKNGTTTNARMNYNLFFGQIQFIAANGDTLLLSDPETISEVVIGYDLYYFLKGEGHVEQVLSKNNIILTKREMLTYSGKEKYASYGQYSSTGAITTYSSYNSDIGSSQRLARNTQTVLVRRANFYFIDKNQKFYSATRSNLLRIFPKNKRAINDYFNQNTVNFDNEAQLKDLVSFCSDF